MKTVRKKFSLLVRLSITATAMLMGQQAMAEGTDTNWDTDVSNTATVNYDVASTAQTPVSSLPVVFKVDRKINFTVTEVTAGATPTTLGEDGTLPGNDNYIEYLVTNLTNGPMDFRLSVLTPQSAGDDFDMLVPRVELDDGSDPWNGNDYIDNLAEDASVTVRIYATTPSTGPTNGQTADLSLVAQAADPSGDVATPGAVLTESGSWNQGTVDNVLADAGRDNSESFEDSFILEAPTLAVAKTVDIVSDPFNLLVNPKAIPGAIMEYEIEIDNTGLAAATNISISDVIDANVEVVAGANNVSIFDGIATTITCTAEVVGGDGNGDGCWYEPVAVVGPPAIAARTLTVSGFDVPAGQTWTITFQVTIQ